MRNGLAPRISMTVLLVVCAAGVASSQARPPLMPNAISWGWESAVSPDLSQAGGGQNSDKPATTPVGSGPQEAGASSGQSAETPDGQTPDNSSSDDSAKPASNPPADSSSNPPNVINLPSSADLQTDASLPAPARSSSSLLQNLRSPFQVEPQGVKIGPAYLTNISDGFFFAANTAPGRPTQTYMGNSLSANIGYNRQIGDGALSVQSRQQFSLSESTPYYNGSVTAGYSDQLTERWSVNAAAQLTYFQNTILGNPQYLLAEQNGTLVTQTLFNLRRGSSFYEANSINFDYTLSGTTHLTLSPIVGATFLDNNGVWTTSRVFGGAVALSRDVTSSLTLGGFYSLSHSSTSGIGNDWNSESLGFSFQYRPQTSWSISGSIAASGQLVGQVWRLTPTGSLTASKRFSDASVIFGAFARTEAGSILASSGYYEQGDVGYSRKLGDHIRLNGSVGVYRTSQVSFQQRGKHASISMGYRLTDRLSVNAGYNFAHQTGAAASASLPFLGTTNSFSFGLNWSLGASRY